MIIREQRKGKRFSDFVEYYNQLKQNSSEITMSLQDVLIIDKNGRYIDPCNRKEECINANFGTDTAIVLGVTAFPVDEQIIVDLGGKVGLKGQALATPSLERNTFLNSLLAGEPTLYTFQVINGKITSVHRKASKCPSIIDTVNLVPTHNTAGKSYSKTITKWIVENKVMQVEITYNTFSSDADCKPYFIIQDSESGESSLQVKMGIKYADTFFPLKTFSYRHDKAVSTMEIYEGLVNNMQVFGYFPWTKLRNTNESFKEMLSTETLTLIGRKNVKAWMLDPSSMSLGNQIATYCQLAERLTENWEIKRKEHFYNIFTADVLRALNVI